MLPPLADPRAVNSIDYFILGRDAKYCDEYVCLLVCVCVRLLVHSHNSRTTRPIFTKFLCMLPVAVGRSSSDGVAICCLFPVLWNTFLFHTMGPIGRNQSRHYVSMKLAGWRHRLEVRFIEFIIMRLRGQSLLSTKLCICC